MPVLGVYGNFIAFIFNSISYMRHLYQDYGEIASLARGTSKYVFVFGPQYNQQVLSDTVLFQNLNANSSPLRMQENSALTRLYTGLTNMNGAKHKRQRRLIASALHKKRIDGYRDDIVALIERRLAGWRAGHEHDLFKEMRELTLSVAVKTLIGLEPSQEGEVMSRLLERWMGMVFSVPAILFPFNIPGLPYHRLLELSEQLDSEIRVLIERRRASSTEQGDVLSLLLQAHDEDGTCLSDEELLGQTNFLFMAGHATTASVLTWTLFLLSQHSRLMSDLVDELEGTLHGSAPDAGHLAELPLLEGVIKESMRLLPPVMWWSRVSTAPFNLGPYHFLQGTHVVYSAYITHRIPELYQQPNKFLPERWLTSNPGPYEYVPFSAGPRMCLGAMFAMIEMKLVLATLLQRFRLTLRPGARVDYGGLMLSQPKQGLPMMITQQDHRFTKSAVHGNIRTLVDLGSPAE
jgi:cytochrome P450